MNRPLTALLVDPALFTAPYDAALTAGLHHAGVLPQWAGRPLRKDEADASAPSPLHPIFYRGNARETVKGKGPLPKLRKLLSHLAGGARLLRMARRDAYSVVHFQWAVLPVFDAMVMRWLARRRPVILTVHDLSPFNDAPSSRFQLVGFERALRAADRLIVHTASARDTLIAQGHAPERVVHIPHGPLTLGSFLGERSPRSRDQPWRLVLFGKLQAYKGVDVLIEALGRLAPVDRDRLRVIVAGEPLIAVEPLMERAAALGLDAVLELRLGRQTELEMARLFTNADAFVFPYRHIEASGVLHLVLPFERWIVASDLGGFRDLVVDGVNGRRVGIGDPDALAAALVDSIGRVPDPQHTVSVPGWDEIGARTRSVYEEALHARKVPR